MNYKVNFLYELLSFGYLKNAIDIIKYIRTNKILIIFGIKRIFTSKYIICILCFYINFNENIDEKAYITRILQFTDKMFCRQLETDSVDMTFTNGLKDSYCLSEKLSSMISVLFIISLVI
jgi:hypothetical protein